MPTVLKIVTSEQVCNDSPNSYSSTVVRLVNKGDAEYTLTQKEHPVPLVLTIDTSANDSTLLTLSSGDTSDVLVGDIIVNSTNTDVVNTGVDSVIDTIVNSTAVSTNVDIIVANGDCTVYAVRSIKTMTILPNTELLLEKRPSDWIETDESANVLAMGVAWKG